MHLIGINGFKRSGKGETANALSALYGDGEKFVYQIGFADKLKRLAALTLGFQRPPQEAVALMDEAKESWDIYINTPEGVNWHDLTGRELLQNLGNEARGLFGDTFWIDQVLPRPDLREDPVERALVNQFALEGMYPDIDCVAITDLRYPNEAERVKALGGVVWEVIRPGTGSDGHASEQPLPRELVDWQIDNSGDFRALEQQVEQALDETL